jgi:hypothetical protein
MNFGFRISDFGFRIAILLVIAFIALEASGFAQCAMCRTALESSPEGQAIAGGFRKGIVLLLAAPYAILGTISYFAFRAYRKKAAQK